MKSRHLLLGAAALVLVVVAALVLTSEDDLQVAPLPDTPTLVGSLVVEPALPRAGQEVVVRATVSADRRLTLRALTVQVQDEHGTRRDFPLLRDHQVDTSPQEIVLRRVFDDPGTYTYYLAYRVNDGEWQRLRPWQDFTVR